MAEAMAGGTPATHLKFLWKATLHDSLDPLRIGVIDLPHRLAMAPTTRDRSRADGVPTDLNREYYTQRASMALIITEGTQPSADGQGDLLTPGIYTVDHVDGWRAVTDAVHAAGGRIVVQLMHTGRIAHPDNTPHHRQPVAPSESRPSPHRPRRRDRHRSATHLEDAFRILVPIEAISQRRCRGAGTRR
jgi:2,4-dienoyl-CoA reductase-like NADH-dependent reductase (Old Yellow Enzyme family)